MHESTLFRSLHHSKQLITTDRILHCLPCSSKAVITADNLALDAVASLLALLLTENDHNDRYAAVSRRESFLDMADALILISGTTVIT